MSAIFTPTYIGSSQKQATRLLIFTMQLTEHQAKNILTQNGLRVPRGALIHSPEEIDQALAFIGTNAVMLKAQVLMGGRGKAGGVLAANDARSARRLAQELFLRRIHDLPVQSILVEEKLVIESEIYVGVASDLDEGLPVLLCSLEGGMDVESSAGRIERAEIDPWLGVQSDSLKDLLRRANIPHDLQPMLAEWLTALYKLYRAYDAELVEINPLVLTPQRELIAADARMFIDDNALFRQPEIQSLRILNERQQRAENARINFQEIEGDIGIIGTGAGMAMANMDQVIFVGGRPANFMDIGPGMYSGGPEVGLDLLFERPGLKAILVSGYTASELTNVSKQLVSSLERHRESKLPVVVRLEGRHRESAYEILKSSSYPNLHLSDDFESAARLAVELAK